MEPLPTYATGETPKPGDFIRYDPDGRTARVHGLLSGKLWIRWDERAGHNRRASIQPGKATLISRFHREVAS